MAGWLYKEERDTIGADHQDFKMRAFAGPPREQVTRAQLHRDTPLDVRGITKLTANLNADDTTISVESTDGFDESGWVFVDSEYITYSGKTATTFTGIGRGSEIAFHTTGAFAYKFTEITERVYGIDLSGSIDSHEFTATITGEDYDHLLLRPDRSIYFEVRYSPVFGHHGPRVNDGFSGIDGISVGSSFILRDSDGNQEEPRGMAWNSDGWLWVATANEEIIRIDPLSGEVKETLTHSLTGLEGLAVGKGDNLWVVSKSVGESTIYNIDSVSGNTISSFTIGREVAGITWDGTYLYFCDDDSLLIDRYLPDGTFQTTLASPDPDPAGMSYWDGDLWIIGANSGSLYRTDKDIDQVYEIHETGLSDPQALAISEQGGRIGNAGDDKIYRLQVGAREGLQVGKFSFTADELFTGTTGVVGGSWDDSGNLWLAYGNDTIAQVNGTTGALLDSFSSPVTGLASIAHDQNGKVWVGSSAGGTKFMRRIELGPNSVDASIEVPDTAVGLDFDSDTDLIWALCADGNLYTYGTDGSQMSSATRGLADPGGLAKVGQLLYVIDGNRVKIFDTSLKLLVWSVAMPTDTSDPQAFAMSNDYGNRVMDGTSGVVYDFVFGTSKDDRQTTGGFSEWLPFYFGYIEQGSITVDHLKSTWSLRCRSTWMYLGQEEAAGRNLAPAVISSFKPTRCSSVLSDPALEIGNEYISSPGEGVGCGNIVDDDLTTTWISQNAPFMNTSPDPMPTPTYGCEEHSLTASIQQVAQASNIGDDRLYIDIALGFPTNGRLGVWINQGEANEEFIRYTIVNAPTPDPPTIILPWPNNWIGGFVDAVGQPTTLQKAHARFEPVNPIKPCIHQKTSPLKIEHVAANSEYCAVLTTYEETGVVVPPRTGETYALNERRRLIFTELYKPRLGLRQEYNWWIEMRNMSDNGHANLLANSDWSPWALDQGFLVMKWYDLDNTFHTVNLPISILERELLQIGPEPDNPDRSRCIKDWLVIVPDHREFRRWWSTSAKIVSVGGVPSTFPFWGGSPIEPDFRRGELRYYWMSNHPQLIDDRQAMLPAGITATDTTIQVRDVTLYPSPPYFAMIRAKDLINDDLALGIRHPYEWITFTGTSTAGVPAGAPGANPGFLTGVTRGVLGTVATGWDGRADFPTNFRGEQIYDGKMGQVLIFHSIAAGEDIETNQTTFGSSDTDSIILSDIVKFPELTNLNVEAGRSFQRNGDNEWQWERNSVPSPGSKLKQGTPEWFSVDLGEIDPPTVRGITEDTDSYMEINSANAGSLTNSGVILVDQEYIKYESINRDPSRIAARIYRLESLTRGYDGTSPAQHDDGAQVWQVINRHALVEHLISGVSWHRKPDAPDGIPTHYRIYTTWRQNPRYPDQQSWENDWDMVWSVTDNAMKNRGHFIQEFADLDSGADSTRPPGILGFHEARHVMMVIDQTNSGRAKINEFKVYSTNPRLNLLAGSLDRETAADSELSEMQNSIAVFFDYVTRGFGLDPEEVVVIGTGVNFFELPIGAGSYQSILAQLAENTGYRVWFNRFNQMFFVPDPGTRRSMPLMTNLDDTLMRDQLQIISQPTGNVSQVTVYFRDELSDETFAVSYPEQARGEGNTLEFDGVVVASTEEAKEIARQIYLQENGEWEVVASFGVGHQFIMGHRYTVTESDWEASSTYFQGQNFYVSGINYRITFGPQRRWDTSVTLKEYHPSV